MIFSLANGLFLAGLMFCVTRPASVRDLEAFYAYFPFKLMVSHFSSWKAITIVSYQP
jgi:hypothetical protein